MDISIRPATIDDASKIANIFQVSVRSLCTQEYLPAQIDIIASLFDAQSYREAIETEELDIFIAEAEDIVGFISLMPEEWRIGDLFIHPDFTRQGIATLLLDTLEKYAVQKQIFRLSVTASLTARSFYAVRGYQYQRDSFIAQNIPTVEMMKILTPHGSDSFEFGSYENNRKIEQYKLTNLRDLILFIFRLLFDKPS